MEKALQGLHASVSRIVTDDYEMPLARLILRPYIDDYGFSRTCIKPSIHRLERRKGGAAHAKEGGVAQENEVRNSFRRTCRGYRPVAQMASLPDHSNIAVSLSRPAIDMSQHSGVS